MIKRHSGFTLMELMISIGIIGILAGIAYPSYTEYVVQSNRAEAQNELLRLANRQEQYFVDHRVYTTNMKLLGVNASPYVTDSGNYKISSTVNNGSFTLTANALGTQLSRDAECAVFSVTETGKKDATSTDCWEK